MPRARVRALVERAAPCARAGRGVRRALHGQGVHLVLGRRAAAGLLHHLQLAHLPAGGAAPGDALAHVRRGARRRPGAPRVARLAWLTTTPWLGAVLLMTLPRVAPRSPWLTTTPSLGAVSRMTLPALADHQGLHPLRQGRVHRAGQREGQHGAAQLRQLHGLPQVRLGLGLRLRLANPNPNRSPHPHLNPKPKP